MCRRTESEPETPADRVPYRRTHEGPGRAPPGRRASGRPAGPACGSYPISGDAIGDLRLGPSCSESSP